MPSMNSILIVVGIVAIGLIVLDPVNWIKLALWIVTRKGGAEARRKFILNLHSQIVAEEDLQKRWMFDYFFCKALKPMDILFLRDDLNLNEENYE